MDAHEMAHIRPQSAAGESSVELSARRTGMSFQRTRMSADRTLMSVIRTSLSLITFGFTIFEFFRALDQPGGRSIPARNFAVSLVLLGVLMLSLGIVYHGSFMLALRKTRADMTRDGLIHGESPYPASLTLIVALLMLVIGVSAVVSMVFRADPLG
jgi:putative membrane protein